MTRHSGGRDQGAGCSQSPEDAEAEAPGRGSHAQRGRCPGSRPFGPRRKRGARSSLPGGGSLNPEPAAGQLPRDPESARRAGARGQPSAFRSAASRARPLHVRCPLREVFATCKRNVPLALRNLTAVASVPVTLSVSPA